MSSLTLDTFNNITSNKTVLSPVTSATKSPSRRETFDIQNRSEQAAREKWEATYQAKFAEIKENFDKINPRVIAINQEISQKSLHLSAVINPNIEALKFIQKFYSACIQILFFLPILGWIANVFLIRASNKIKLELNKMTGEARTLEQENLNLITERKEIISNFINHWKPQVQKTHIDTGHFIDLSKFDFGSHR